jgi:very-short-patch-repair endonuclease
MGILNKCKLIHNNKYDYSLVEYKNMKTKVKIICPIHGVFEQNLNNHIYKKYGCPDCGGTKKINTEEFIKKSKKIHNNKYDYSLVEYKNMKTKVKIICPIHGEFEQEPRHHLNNSGCQICNGGVKYNNKIFIINAIKTHGNKYDYSLVDYKNNNTNIKIICPIHGVFEQNPNNHISKKYGCPICSESKGEKQIRLYLQENNVKYERQKKFKDCKYKYPLPFDFYLIEYDLCIEYDGEQHYKSFDFFGGDKRLKIQQKKDKIKNDFCEKNNINLLRIKYDENIYEKLNFLI